MDQEPYGEDGDVVGRRLVRKQRGGGTGAQSVGTAVLQRVEQLPQPLGDGADAALDQPPV